LYANPLIRGFTTNPTLMRKAGVTGYERFARDVLQCIPDRPVSLEVFADEFPEMERQARKIATWGEPAFDLIHRLALRGVKLNVTALLALGSSPRSSQRAGRRGAILHISICGTSRRHR